MSGAAIAAGVELGAKLLPTAITVVEELVRAIRGEDQQRAALEQVANLAARLGAIPTASSAASEAFDRAAEARRRALRARGTDPASLPPVLVVGPSVGKVAFEAYSAARGGKNHDGSPTPVWEALGEGVREGWEAAALAARSTT